MQALSSHSTLQHRQLKDSLPALSLPRITNVQQRLSAARAAAINNSRSQLPEPIAEPVAYTKAFLSVVLQHITEAALDAAADLSIQLAEQPKRMREFAEDVQAAANRELQGAGTQQQLLLSASTSGTTSSSTGASSSYSSSAASGSIGVPATDLAALVDDLRADIAASRALLQQIRSSSSSSSSNSSNGAQVGRR